MDEKTGEANKANTKENEHQAGTDTASRIKKSKSKLFSTIFGISSEEFEDDEKESDVNPVHLHAKIVELKQRVKHQSFSLPEDLLQRYLKLVSEMTNTTEGIDYDVDLDFIRRIIDKVDVNYKSKYGDMALHEACKIREKPPPDKSSKAIDVFKFLLENGAKLYAENDYGHTVLHTAAYFDNSKLINFIIEKDRETRNELVKSKKLDELTASKMALLTRKTHKERQTPMHCAAQNGNKHAIDALYAADDFEDRQENILEDRDIQGFY